MGILYWLAVWIMMAVAFTAAWSFIIKGCEALDEAHPPEQGGEEPAHH